MSSASARAADAFIAADASRAAAAADTSAAGEDADVNPCTQRHSLFLFCFAAALNAATPRTNHSVECAQAVVV